MNDYGPAKGKEGCVPKRKVPGNHWASIVDRVEAAILMSLANRILADATGRQNQVDECRKQLKLVELKNFSRKDSVA